MRARSKLKAVGLTLSAVLATSAMIASAAQANPNPLHWTCAKYPCVITGEQTEAHKFIVGAKTLSCHATQSDATIASADQSTEITVTPTYKACTASPGEAPMTVTMNGCDYRLHGGVEDKFHHFVEGTMDIVCPREKSIKVHIYQNVEKHAQELSVCTFTIHEQTATGNTFTNTTETPWDVHLTMNAKVKVTAHPPGLLCGSTEQEAIFTGKTTLRAYEDKGNHTNGAGETVYTEGSQIGLTISESF